jgi:hypothetical protein
MRTDRVVVGVVAVCIVGLTLATGPVGLLDIGTSTGGLDDPGSGTATIEVLSEPDGVTLEPSDDGQNLLHLSVPATLVDVSNVTGNPILSYQVRLNGAGLSTDTIAFLGDQGPGELEMSFDRRTYQPYEVQNVTDADLTLRIRSAETETIFEKTVPVERP